MRGTTIASAGLALALGAFAAGAAPVTKEQLLSMAREKVDAKVILAIVGRDCVDFDVDAGNAAELSRALPPEVLEAAIGCRKAAPKAAAPSPPPAESAAPAPAKEAPAPASGTLRLRAQFIGESAALSCVCLVDGREAATLTKEAQGEFGEAVARTKIGRQSPDLSLPAGKHRVVFRCDPKAQEVSVDVDVLPGKLRTVEVRETTLRSWKLRRVE